jgi:hypothetical protein
MPLESARCCECVHLATALLLMASLLPLSVCALALSVSIMAGASYVHFTRAEPFHFTAAVGAASVVLFALTAVKTKIIVVGGKKAQ